MRASATSWLPSARSAPATARWPRARTGLALLRTGVTLGCLGLGLIKYFGLSPLSIFDGVLILAGLLMIVEGTVWYWPVRREPTETPRCIEWGNCED